MLKKNYFIVLLILLFFIISNNTYARCSRDKDLPLRDIYLTINCINSQQLIEKITSKSIILIDARTDTEFNILKITGAVNIDIDKKQHFIQQLKDIRANDDREIVFYCNGKRCNLSYRAGQLAQQIGIKNSTVYDAGIFTFAKIEAHKVLLFNQPISADNKLIPPSEYQRHLISLEAFVSDIAAHIENDIPYRILDIRDEASHYGSSAFVGIMHERYIPLSKTAKLIKYLKVIARKDIDIYVYDWAGAKLQWVQYYLEQQHVKNYFFLKGGAFHKINQELKANNMPPLPL